MAPCCNFTDTHGKYNVPCWVLVFVLIILPYANTMYNLLPFCFYFWCIISKRGLKERMIENNLTKKGSILSDKWLFFNPCLATLYYFPSFFITKYCKLRGLIIRNNIASWFWKPDIKYQGFIRVGSTARLWAESLLCLYPSSLWFTDPIGRSLAFLDVSIITWSAYCIYACLCVFK